MKETAVLETEKDFQEWLRQLALVTHWLYFHVHRSTHSPAGFPDAVLLRPPRLIILELKTDDLKVSQPSIDQYIWLAMLQDIALVETYLVRPSDKDFIEELLK